MNLQLLRHAGCEFGDLAKLVQAAFGKLLRQGVYMTVDELKGRRPIVRVSSTINVAPQSLSNPLGRVQFHGRAAAAAAAEPTFPSGSTAFAAFR